MSCHETVTCQISFGHKASHSYEATYHSHIHCIVPDVTDFLNFHCPLLMLSQHVFAWNLLVGRLYKRGIAFFLGEFPSTISLSTMSIGSCFLVFNFFYVDSFLAFYMIQIPNASHSVHLLSSSLNLLQGIAEIENR